MARNGTVRSVAFLGLALMALSFSSTQTFVPGAPQEQRVVMTAVPAGLAALQGVAPAFAEYIPTPEVEATKAVANGKFLQYGQVLYQQEDGSQSDIWLNLFCLGLFLSLFPLIQNGLKKES
eukprot:CAMPEP_0178400776 /NCGR_PEP_ID=MMETSP0689_2-20121128/15962_1 /TAXON_ID=160604 /ORGANISM="Amphidinium massartii, Strain CS-259" /LENGTH=120 /DNA_ID=CAMNT_0020021579 /DNA_START=81 /DNA_END=443 /DNA_ORIENTATION=-